MRKGKKASELFSMFRPTPQVLENISVKDKSIISSKKCKFAIKYLKIAKLEAEATMEAAMRPKEVLLKYRELRREAARDEKTLFSLEDDLRMLKLQQARLSDPWQLITKPTLLTNPVGISKKSVALLGLILGGVLGILFLSLIHI